MRTETNEYVVVKDGVLKTRQMVYEDALEVASGVEERVVPVFDEGRPKVYDSDIHGPPEFDFSYDVDENQVVRVWKFSYSDAIRENALRKVDMKVHQYFAEEGYLSSYILREYIRTEREADRFLDLTSEEQEQADYLDWPFLAAGVNRDEIGGGLCESLYDAAIAIKNRTDELDQKQSQFRKARKDVKFKIERADSKEKIAELYFGFLPDYTASVAKEEF